MLFAAKQQKQKWQFPSIFTISHQRISKKKAGGTEGYGKLMKIINKFINVKKINTLVIKKYIDRWTVDN